jgi:hypothetical protein
MTNGATGAIQHRVCSDTDQNKSGRQLAERVRKLEAQQQTPSAPSVADTDLALSQSAPSDPDTFASQPDPSHSDPATGQDNTETLVQPAEVQVHTWTNFARPQS